MREANATSRSAPAGYRRCVGVALFNAQGRVFVGRRRAPGRLDPGAMPHRWQMPQGGVDRGEAPLEAAKRELREETGVRSVALLAEAPDWFDYDFPPDIVSATRGGKFIGQTQLWFAFRFLGDDGEIDLAPPGHKPELYAWRWENLQDTPSQIVPFKRGVYDQVVKAFEKFAG